MIPNDDIKDAVVAYLKSKTAVIVRVPAVEIREAQWRGTSFTYPNIRVRVIRNNPINGSKCAGSSAEIGVMIFTEDDSSLEADEILGIIVSELHDKSFITSGLAFTGVICQNQIPAFSINTKTWMSEGLFRITSLTNAT